MSEQDYINGSKAAYTNMMSICLKAIGHKKVNQLVEERQMAILALRSICKRHGDNDWDDDLHLADIIGKHLYL